MGELARTMSAAEFAAWVEYAKLEPFGPRQDDYRAAVAAILPAQALSGEKIEAEDLFVSLRPTPEQQAAARAKKKAESFRRFDLWAKSQLALQAKYPNARNPQELARMQAQDQNNAGL